MDVFALVKVGYAYNGSKQIALLYIFKSFQKAKESFIEETQDDEVFERKDYVLLTKINIKTDDDVFLVGQYSESFSPFDTLPAPDKEKLYRTEGLRQRTNIASLTESDLTVYHAVSAKLDETSDGQTGGKKKKKASKKVLKKKASKKKASKQ